MFFIIITRDGLLKDVSVVYECSVLSFFVEHDMNKELDTKECLSLLPPLRKGEFSSPTPSEGDEIKEMHYFV